MPSINSVKEKREREEGGGDSTPSADAKSASICTMDCKAELGPDKWRKTSSIIYNMSLAQIR